MKARKRINFEYFSMWREIPLLFFVELFKRRKSKINNNRILIVCPCLIGEFVASIPALHDYITRNHDKKVDLFVTPQVRDLAGKIFGVNSVFITKSAYLGRNLKKVNYNKQDFGQYEKIIYLRISELAYTETFKIKGAEIQTAFSKMFIYTLHLVIKLIVGQTPKRWGSLNFDILGGKEKQFSFEQMFNFTNDDIERVNSLSIIKEKQKIIIIHVGTRWVMKRWDRDRWVELLKKINKIGDFKFVFVGSDDDIEDHEYISSRLDFKTESVINQISLSDLPLVMNKSKLFIGIDSGPSNMAHLVGLRSITIYGPGPHMYMPTDSNDIVFDKTNGRGLFQLLFEVKNSYINKISTEEVYEAFCKLIQ